MFGESIVKDLEKKLKPVLEESRRQHKIGVVLQATAQIIGAERMRGNDINVAEEHQIISRVLDMMCIISDKIK